MSEFGCCAEQHNFGVCSCPRHERSALHPLGDVANLCPHDDDPLCCPPCVNARRPKPTAVTELGAVFLARYAGDCSGCHLPIHEGQRIRKAGPRFVHEGCES